MSSKICHAIITDYKALLCTRQQGGPKVTEGAPYFHCIGTWGPHNYCKIRAGGDPFKGGPRFFMTQHVNKPCSIRYTCSNIVPHDSWGRGTKCCTHDYQTLSLPTHMGKDSEGLASETNNHTCKI